MLALEVSDALDQRIVEPVPGRQQQRACGGPEIPRQRLAAALGDAWLRGLTTPAL